MGVSRKTLVGATTVAVALALAGWTAPVSSDPVERLLLLKDLKNGVTDAESITNRFLLDYPRDGLLVSQARVVQLKEILDGLQATLGKIERTDAGEPAGSGDGVKAIRTELDAFDSHAKRVVASAKARGDASSGIVWEMRRMVEGLERYLVQLEVVTVRGGSDPARVQALERINYSLQRIRTAEKDYMLWHDLVYISSIRSEVEAVEKTIVNDPLTVKERDRIRTYLKTYLIYFERLLIGDIRMLEERNEMAKSAERVNALVEIWVEREREAMGLPPASASLGGERDPQGSLTRAMPGF